MAARTLVSLEEYLRTSYEPDADYVDGEVEERNAGERDHSGALSDVLCYLGDTYPILRRRLLPILKIRVGETRIRVADVCILASDAPDEQIPTHPPVLCIEILSPEDRMTRFMERLNDYFEMGVPLCWIVDPITRWGWVATPGHLDEAVDGVLRSGEFEMPLAAIFE
jgi:Uma2 family endonuclease